MRTRDILGAELAVTDYRGALETVAHMISATQRGYVCHAAVGAVMNARRDPEVMAALNGATLTVPDGMPLVWALRALGEEISDRVYGPDLMLRACDELTGARHFLYGGRDVSATAELAAGLARRFPSLEIAGSWTPPFRELKGTERSDVAQLINSSGADIVWVGTGSPRQERWMAQMRPALQAPVLIGVGAAFDFHAGRVAQAPGWMQRNGLEWLYRVTREPLRLGPRYLRDNPAFLAAFASQWLAERR